MVKLNFDNPTEIIYTPELAEEDELGLTTEDFLELCNGSRDVAVIVAQLTEWQHPSTILAELIMEGEIEEEIEEVVTYKITTNE